MSDDDKKFFEELTKEFLVEAGFLLEQSEESCLALEDESGQKQALDELFRVYHSIKGGAAAVNLPELSEFAHHLENILSFLRTDRERIDTRVTNLLFRSGDAIRLRITQLRKGEEKPWENQTLIREIENTASELERSSGAGKPKSQDVAEDLTAEESVTRTTVRVGTGTIDTVLNLVGELVVIKSQLLHGNMLSTQKSAGLESLLNLFDKTVRELQDRALQMRMTPLKKLFMKAQRQVRELSQELGKPVHLDVSGDSTEIDRDLIEQLGDPLIHLLRNAIDHGIEDPSERRQANKSEEANISLSAKQVRGRIVIELTDDGRGINPKAVVDRAHDKGILAADVSMNTMTEQEIFDLLFMPGFSTRTEITDISGRGVGLDIVKSNIERIKGLIEVESKFGVGTTFRLSIPLTAAIFDGMVVIADGSYFILPLEKLIEIVDIRSVPQVDAGGQAMIELRDELIPIINLQRTFSKFDELDKADPEKAPISLSEVVIIVQYYSQKIGLQVHSVVGQAQVVVKPLGERFNEVPDVSGAAILGDGKIALIVDTDELGKRFSIPSNKSLKEKNKELPSNHLLVGER